MKHPASTAATLLTLFLAAQFIGLLVVSAYVDAKASEQASIEAGKPITVYENLPYNIERPQIAPDTSFIFLSAALIIGTLLLLLVIRLRKVSLWKLWFFMAVTITLSVSISAFLPQAAAFLIALAFAFMRIFKPNVFAHNISELFIYGGLAAIFVPIISLKSAAIFLLIIAAYDFIAVFRTRHMVTLAKFQTENKIFAGLFVPKRLTAKSAVSSISYAPKKQSLQEKYSDSGDYAIIGGGDIGFPLLFAGAAMASFGLAKTLIIPLAATIALGVLLALSKKGKFYPAMPFIAAGCFLGYGLASLF